MRSLPNALQQPPAVAIRREPWLKHLLNETPAWLISMLVHLVLLTLLALLTHRRRSRPTARSSRSAPTTTASASEGGDTVQIKPDELAQFDLPLPSKADLNDDRSSARCCSPPPRTPASCGWTTTRRTCPTWPRSRDAIGRADGFAHGDGRPRSAAAGRDGHAGRRHDAHRSRRRPRPAVAGQPSEQRRLVEPRGLQPGGRLQLRGRRGTTAAKSPGTALAMLPFLGAGQTHLAGKYKGTVSRGLRWLIQNQKDDGDLRAGANGNEGMYTHGQAAIVLCEAFAMTGDEELRVPAQKAIDFIVAAQYNDGGWRYQPGPRTPARRHERRRLAAHGPAIGPGREPDRARRNLGPGRPLPRQRAAPAMARAIRIRPAADRRPR